MPSTCALFLKYQIKLNYSIGAHAFDIFQNNGDILLNIKAINCNFIHTSTLNGVYRLRKKLFLFNKKIKLIRRGLVSISFKLPQRKVSSKKIINIFSVGRLVFKKDYKFQLFLLHSLMKNNIKAKLTICGNGLLLKKLLYYIANLNLNLYIKIFYNLNFRSLKKLYKKFDVFIFTGKTLLDGDKDGLPNVIAEAMSFGVPVISFNIGGVPEVIKPNKNGFVMSIKNLFLFVEKLVSNFKCNKKHRKICIMSQI
ncbi:glycosyltransferase [Candidatus Pinguicoccus supinus]|uniref:Glycosyltransferase n=1 Tax=Candidatus Pinguicoccus supinus TaxID=2529394 RepID=A0A7T0BRS5_9BACT|nr:glycosyltransferase [Candidatus Pinguicoccus supinus]